MLDKRQKIYGLIFAGGKSRRMGQSKAHLTIHELPQYAHLLTLFEKIGLVAYVSCRTEQIDSFPAGTPCLPDNKEEIGPMAGLLAAFAYNDQVSWLCVACDMPLLDDHLLAELIKKQSDPAWASCMLSPRDNRPEPFCSIWTPQARVNLLTAYENQEYSLRALLESKGAQHIPCDQPDKLMNINTREDLNQFINRTI